MVKKTAEKDYSVLIIAIIVVVAIIGLVLVFKGGNAGMPIIELGKLELPKSVIVEVDNPRPLPTDTITLRVRGYEDTPNLYALYKHPYLAWYDPEKNQWIPHGYLKETVTNEFAGQNPDYTMLSTGADVLTAVASNYPEHAANPSIIKTATGKINLGALNLKPGRYRIASVVMLGTAGKWEAPNYPSIILEVQGSVETCDDSDGKDYYVAGTVISGDSKYNDICNGDGLGNPLNANYPANAVVERYCEGSQVKTEYYTCPNKCSNGACIRLVEPVPVTEVSPTALCSEGIKKCTGKTLEYCQGGKWLKKDCLLCMEGVCYDQPEQVESAVSTSPTVEAPAGVEATTSVAQKNIDIVDSPSYDNDPYIAFGKLDQSVYKLNMIVGLKNAGNVGIYPQDIKVKLFVNGNLVPTEINLYGNSGYINGVHSLIDTSTKMKPGDTFSLRYQSSNFNYIEALNKIIKIQVLVDDKVHAEMYNPPDFIYNYNSGTFKYRNF